MEQKPISRARIKQLLKNNARVKTVSKLAVDWVIAVAECAARSLAAQGGLTPTGQLRAPRMDAGLMARQLSKAPEADTYPGQQAAEYQMAHGGQIDWSEYNDWQTAVKRGETKLPFEEWKKEKEK